MTATIQAQSKESGETYTVCLPIMIVPNGENLKGVMLGLTQKTAALEVPDSAEEAVPVIMQLTAAFGDRFEFQHVRMK